MFLSEFRGRFPEGFSGCDVCFIEVCVGRCIPSVSFKQNLYPNQTE